MKRFQFKRLAKNMKRRRILIGIAVGAVVIAATIIVAVLMDAVTINLVNSNPNAGRLLGGGRIVNGSSVMIRAQANPGYVFTNWTNVDDSIASEEPEHRLAVPESGITLTANWAIVNWDIILYLDGGVNAPDNPSTFTVESETIYLNPPTKEGYTFLGWYKDAALKQEAKDYIPKGTAENVILYAKWAVSYPIEYRLMDERASNDPDNPTTYTAESNVVLEIPVCYELNAQGMQTGGTYNFLGWHDEDGNEIKVISKDWKRPVTLIAYWDLSRATYYSLYTKGKYTYVDIGRYPQHILDNQRTINELKTVEPNAAGLYSYKGILYAKAVAAPYQTNTYYSDGSEIKAGEEYFFIVEPITWRVLSGNPNDPNSTVMLLSEDVLNARAFREHRTVIAKNGNIVYSNNWEYSDVRAFLNGEFYQNAFMDGERALISLTSVDFSSKTSHFARFANGKSCDDYVYLLSYADTANREYGWAHWTIKDDSRKVGKATDYAKAMGVYASLNRGGEHDASHYWLRSSGEFEGRAGVATALGNVGTYSVECAAIGVRPVINVKLS